MSKRIIDNKRVEMTNDEFLFYEKICRSYDRPNFQGEELFKSHFDTNESGIIIFVRPPQAKYSSLEVYCFLISLMVNQHLRISQEQNVSMLHEASEKINELIKTSEQQTKRVEELLAELSKYKEQK